MADKNKGTNTDLVIEKINELYDLTVAEGLAEVEFKDAEVYIKIKRKDGKKKHRVDVKRPSDKREVQQGINKNRATIKSPLNGVFYRMPSPGEQPFVKEGDDVHAGSVLCVIEAMKVMNEIKADARMKIHGILIENGGLVTAEQDIFVVEYL
ncbi:MAG: biotin/lipoyl-containing protein [Elusimicrobiota bacterium]